MLVNKFSFKMTTECVLTGVRIHRCVVYYLLVQITCRCQPGCGRSLRCRLYVV